MSVFSDGLLVGGRPARSFEDFGGLVKDVCDGYFPQEFKAQYPDGIKLDVRDCPFGTRAVPGRPGVGSEGPDAVRYWCHDMRVDDFLNKLPQKTIVDGRPVDVRDAIRERLVPSVRGACAK